MTWVAVSMLAWMTGTVVAAWLPPRRWQPFAIGAVSVAFLLSYSPLSAVLLAVFAVGSYYGVESIGDRAGAVLSIVVACAAVLVWFKLGVDTDYAAHPGELLVPLGLSYYALRAIHYVVERYKGTMPPHGFAQYGCYLFFLPVLMAGPISRFPEFHRDLRRRRWDAALFSRGCERILHGYAKIVILGNYLVSMRLAEAIAAHFPADSALGAYLDCVRFGLNLYLQFSGFSDIAIGFALLIGFRIAENFAAPFLAPNISEFWRRWHMTLSSWCRDYVYLPVAAVTRRPVVGVLMAMLVLGVWHELSARFLVWGLYHGLGIVVWQGYRRLKPSNPLGQYAWARAAAYALSVFLTFNFVMASFAITKEPNLTAALAVYETMLGRKAS